MVAVLSAMKMEMAVQAPMGGKVIRWQISEIQFDQISDFIRYKIWSDADFLSRIVRISRLYFGQKKAKHFAQVKATHVVVGDKVDAEDLLVELE